MLMKLVRKHGYGEYESIINDQLWLCFNSVVIPNILTKSNSSATKIKEYVKIAK